jgi:integrase
MSESKRPTTVGPATFTVADLVKQFIRRRMQTRAPRYTGELVRRPVYSQPAEWLLMRNVLSRIGHMLICDVTCRQVADLLDAIVRRGAPVTANRVYYLLRQCFRFGVASGLMPHSPIEDMRLPGGQESPRTRALSDPEIAQFWARIESANMAARTKLGLKLQLVVAQRPGELTRALWSDFKMETRVWIIPAIHSNRDQPHTVPLSQLAIDLLTELRRMGNSMHVLASPRTMIRSDSPHSAGVLSHAVRRNEPHWGIERFTPYDLRRTAAQGMFNIGVPPRHILKALSRSIHADWAFEKVGRDYFQEKQAALNRWAEHLERLVGIVRADTASKEVVASLRPKARRRCRSLPVAHKGRRPRRGLPK